jgi:DNA-directed RNA polymerase subunit N (RpoN/RPB10)
MIIPVRCMNCGSCLADKWRYYQRRLKELRPAQGGNTIYMDGTSVPDTAERRIFEELGLKRYCCRKHLLTHVDLIEKSK